MLYRPFEALDAKAAWMRSPSWLRLRWPFFVVVVIPTVLAALYLYVFAADQYASEAQYLVRSNRMQTSSLLGQVFGTVMQQASEETSGVNAYLLSHDAVAAVQKEMDVVAMFRRPVMDILNRLSAHPSEEQLLKYYRKHVHVTLDSSTGLSTIQVRAFRPADAQRITESLLRHGEDVVNGFSKAAETAGVKAARDQVNLTRAKLLDIGNRMTAFRNSQQTIDAPASSELILTVVGNLETELAKAQAEYSQTSQYLRPGSPGLVELNNRIGALRAQIAEQRARLTGGANSLAPTVAGYERLKLENEFASKDYAVALASLETARQEAQQQHLYLVRVVEPNRPQQALYPKRLYSLMTIFVSLLVSYAIGWLILAGVREHAA